jgi:iron complex outermembrane receptor protein
MALSPSAAAHAQSISDLTALSIEDLAQIEVTSTSKRAEPLSRAAAAIYVIGNDDIRRSGAPSLPEALRLAPNLNVQRIDARQYSVNARGFGGYETSNKLLVLIDGRSVYSTLASSVFWELRQIMLDDIDRIEVISGPGGALWGTNAVNGVINVTSRSAQDSQGLLARAEGGARERHAALRYGGTIGSSGAYRVYVAGNDREGLPANAGRAAADGGKGLRGGFRADWSGYNDDFTIQGDIFDDDNDVIGGSDRGHNLIARWTKQLDRQSSVEVQAYYDKFSRSFAGVFDSLETLDLAVQGNGSWARHQVVIGAGVRSTRDKFINNLNPFALDPPSRRLWTGNLFAQDRIALRDNLALTAGLKLERSAFTGIEILPNLRLAWHPNRDALLWAAVSRAVRTPSRIDRQLVFLPFLEGGTFKSEELVAIEAGYRGQPAAGTTLSVSFFYNIYDRLRTTAVTPVTIFPLRLDNGLKGHSYGVELWGSFQVNRAWRMSAGASTLHKDFRLKPGHTDLQNGISLGNDPDFQLMLRSQLNLTDTIELDVIVRGVDGLPAPRVSRYVDADARIGWRALPELELYLAGSNLLHDRRDESGDRNRGQLVVRTVRAGVRIGL